MSPRLGVRVAGLAGRVLHRLGLYGTKAPQVEQVFGPLSEDESERLARQISTTALKNRFTSQLVRSLGHERMARLITPESLEIIRAIEKQGAGIIALIHVGPVLGIKSSLHLLGIPATVLTLERHHRGETPLEVIAEFEWEKLDASGTRLRALKSAMDRLRDGGLVFMALDGAGTERYRVRLAGRLLPMPGGPPMLSVMTGAPLFPVTSRWTRSGRIELRSAPPVRAPEGLPREEAELDVADRVIEWFDSYLVENAAQTSLKLLERLHNMPQAADDDSHAKIVQPTPATPAQS